MRTIAFFNNKGGVGKTTLVYHLAWMYREKGKKVLVADLDPQANVTSMFFPEEWLEGMLTKEEGPSTVFEAFRPLLVGSGDISDPLPHPAAEGLSVLAGDLNLSAAEDDLSTAWPRCLDGDQRSFRVISALWRIIERAAAAEESDIVLIDVGPNLGALNRTALVCAHEVVVPLAPDLFSLQGLRNLGPRLKQWRLEWERRVETAQPEWAIPLPPGSMTPLGYVVLQHAVRVDRPVKAYRKWMDRIPGIYAEDVSSQASQQVSVEADPHCLFMLKNYRSLMPLAQEARKPMFLLKASDGALGGHAAAVQACYQDFSILVDRIDSASAALSS